MKNIMNLFWMFILFALLGGKAYPQNRNVIWVHGFNGDAAAWQHYATIFTNERQINSTRQSYPTTNGLTAAANQLKASVISTSSTNLGIGHSMGGVMIREVDRTTTPKKFGGYITVASPNYGAPVSESILSGKVTGAGITALNQLSAGPVADMLQDPFLLVTGSTTLSVAAIVALFTGGLEGIGNFLSPATNQDLKPGSNAMNALNSYTSTAQRISIIAQENSPVHWRLISSQINGNDYQTANTMNDIRGYYHTLYWFHKDAAVVCLLMLNFAQAALHEATAKQWLKGRDWMDNSETIWCSLIKTSRTETYTYWGLRWVPCTPGPGGGVVGPNGIWQVPLEDPNGSGCGEWVEMLLTGLRTVNYPSDGLIPTYAQELVGISVGSPNRYTIDYANHLELKNMSYSIKPNGQANDGTRNTLNAIFNRPQGDWFRTP